MCQVLVCKCINIALQRDFLLSHGVYMCIYKNIPFERDFLARHDMMLLRHDMMFSLFRDFLRVVFFLFFFLHLPLIVNIDPIRLVSFMKFP